MLSCVWRGGSAIIGVKSWAVVPKVMPVLRYYFRHLGKKGSGLEEVPESGPGSDRSERTVVGYDILYILLVGCQSVPGSSEAMLEVEGLAAQARARLTRWGSYMRVVFLFEEAVMWTDIRDGQVPASRRRRRLARGGGVG